MTAHLGTKISALVDGQLPPGATERALAHVAGCPECAAELSAARTARSALAAACDVPPNPDLTARLLSLAGCQPAEPPTPRRDPFAQPGSSGADARAAAYTAPHAMTGDLTARRRPVRVAAAAAACVGLVCGGLFLLGDRPSVLPSSHPAQALALLGHDSAESWDQPRAAHLGLAAMLPGSSAGAAPTASDIDPSAGDLWSALSVAGWKCPVALPEGWTVTDAHVSPDGSRLEVDLAGPGMTAVLTEQPGRLDTQALEGTTQLVLGDRTLYVLSEQPWHGAWQADDLVVEVVATSGTETVHSVVAGFPGGRFDDGLQARIIRGWDTVTQALQKR
ncbi:anti-sigma factor family protein [Cellulomonas chengniuliangii]|uniref:anti-sigma factor family protein n=1 Tax=Cellulomonas chengniuliangii TaxID=2968084 RepID=UPI001D0E95AC|nr:zf-HC2 domain-containing protein [Cellulomonas chengniuliangii]MCC2316411.1 zf-HC2 domain-containing protein [Cellulomonas chengniuliangii]